MNTAAAPSEKQESIGRWSPNAAPVRRLMKWLKARERAGEIVTAEDVVRWDETHGRQLFDWDDKAAAAEWRLQQARVFLNSMRRMVDGMRVRAFINLPGQEGETERGYVATSVISQGATLRQKVIDDITRRMATLASELKMWNLKLTERHRVLAALQEAIGL